MLCEGYNLVREASRGLLTGEKRARGSKSETQAAQRHKDDAEAAVSLPDLRQGLVNNTEVTCSVREGQEKSIVQTRPHATASAPADSVAYQNLLSQRMDQTTGGSAATPPSIVDD